MATDPFFEKLWYGDSRLASVLAPLSWIYAAAMQVRRLGYRAGVLPISELPVPVIVVGNITVGGTGKTPLIIWLAQFLKDRGFRPGIVSRGYGVRKVASPQQVRPDSNPEMVGDEPVLIAQRSGCPVAVFARREVAARELVRHTNCNVLLCDDGLQHYTLGRDIEIAVIDGDRRFGNGRCLPAGPLREPESRLRHVDMVVARGKAGKSEFLMDYVPQPLRSLADSKRQMSVDSLRGREVHAVAGIGNPTRFFSYLRSHELRIVKHVFPDHHPFRAADLKFGDELPIVMTEKDAVKCRPFATDRLWYLPIDAALPAAFQHRLGVLLEELTRGQTPA